MNRPGLLILCGIVLVAAAGGCLSDESAPENGFRTAMAGITGKPLNEYTTWGWQVVDLETGETLARQNERMLFTPGSTVKLFSTAAALDLLGPDYRFRTPVYAAGTLQPDGVLDGPLVLVASGDPTMGGRTLPNGTIEFTNTDHCDAMLPDAQMTTTDPLSGLEDLARQVRKAGIVQADDVIIDTRLFEIATQNDRSPVTPILINDNLVDILITPGAPGEQATVTWRPYSALYTVEADVTTGDVADIAVSSAEGVITVTGTVPPGEPLLRTYTVTDSGRWARSLFIGALERAGVSIEASAAAENTDDDLPDDYTGMSPVAELVSPPFSENVRLILKVSQNLHANTLLGIMAAHEGKTTVEDGGYVMGDFVRKIGIDPASLSLIDGEGSSDNRVSPEAAVALLREMDRRPESGVYRDALPVLGVDGSLAHAARPDNPATGKVAAKTGTTIQSDMNGDAMVLAKGLAGYTTTSDGREVAFALYANNIRIQNLDDLSTLNSDMGSIAGIFWEAF